MNKMSPHLCHCNDHYNCCIVVVDDDDDDVDDNKRISLYVPGKQILYNLLMSLVITISIMPIMTMWEVCSLPLLL